MGPPHPNGTGPSQSTGEMFNRGGGYGGGYPGPRPGYPGGPPQRPGGPPGQYQGAPSSAYPDQYQVGMRALDIIFGDRVLFCFANITHQHL